ncbi:MAG: DUF1295 domain-containing protein [Anaerolineae bacterium]|nr:DUF1295 domain-containing protein [Anaerolineae bacterium]
MQWFPAFDLGWLNGWLIAGLLVVVDGVCFLIFPKPVVTRLFDRSGWQPKQVVLTVISKLVALVFLAQLLLTPLKGGALLILGLCVAALGSAGLAKALIDYRNTPPGEPVERGIYRISRHPQIVMSSVVLLGAAIAIGSWLALITLALARLFGHFSLLAEEEVCLAQYGEDYRAYIQRVPRYFLFF